jgi:hypothetical protein
MLATTYGVGQLLEAVRRSGTGGCWSGSAGRPRWTGAAGRSAGSASACWSPTAPGCGSAVTTCTGSSASPRVVGGLERHRGGAARGRHDPAAGGGRDLRAAEGREPGAGRTLAAALTTWADVVARDLTPGRDLRGSRAPAPPAASGSRWPRRSVPGSLPGAPAVAELVGLPAAIAGRPRRHGRGAARRHDPGRQGRGPRRVARERGRCADRGGGRAGRGGPAGRSPTSRRRPRRSRATIPPPRWRPPRRGWHGAGALTRGAGTSVGTLPAPQVPARRVAGTDRPTGART